MNITVNNKFTQTLATGAAALGVLAGVGLAGAPAQAGTFTLTPQFVPITGSAEPGVPPFVDADSEWGFPGDEPIWSSWPDDDFNNAPGPGDGEGCRHGFTNCVNGWDNALVSHSGSTDGYFKFEFFGSGTSTQTNNFFWNGESLFGESTATSDACPVKASPSPNKFSFVCKTVTRPLQNGDLPFFFRTNLPVDPTDVSNDQEVVPSPIDPTSVGGAHYFATLKGTWTDLNDSNVVYLGFSDGNGGLGSGDDDAADYVIKITSVQQKVPEPGTVLGLLAVGGLGVALKRKKQG